jgi:hypothetical protein
MEKMSNTVHLYALTGEHREGKSLSTADDIAAGFARKLCRQHRHYVPIVWHDVDYPFARVIGECRGEYDFPSVNPVGRIVNAIVALGGIAEQRLVRRYAWEQGMGPWREHQPVTWRLPREVDLALLDAWLATRPVSDYNSGHDRYPVSG